MYQKVIKRKQLLLTGEYEEEFVSGDGDGTLVVQEYGEELISVSARQGESFIRLLISRDDVERLAQAVLVNSHEVKVI